MSDWFKNPSSEIPDEMWRAPTPMQRQADAVVMWAELTGKHASFDGIKALRDKEAAWKPGVAKAIRMGGDNLELTGAALGAPIGGLKAYTDYREGKGGISKAEASLKGEIAKAQSQKADKKKIAKLRQKLQTAKSRRENIGATTAKGVGLGAATGALGTHALKRMRKAGPK